ncbi:hypothetical protein [Streptomyces apocyni]|uniref:hypothetical protein n=1 Tax=Streptomyces apocyni TaxID=2654677 RepID=UPI0012EAE34B|nr:hypothetical protein [Streptomyces apocyni]
MTRSHLAPGVSLVAVPDGGCAVRTPDGEFLWVDTGTVAASRLRDRLAGGSGGVDDDVELAALVRAFERAGYLEATQTDRSDTEGASSWPLDRRVILLTGEPALTGPLSALLAECAAEPRTVAPDEVVDAAEAGGAAAVVWCHDEPVPPGLWDAADRLPERGVGWLRCHREGFQVWIEPLAAGPGDVTSAHVRARRLAATPAHRELAAYWEGRRTEQPFPPTPVHRHLVAAHLAADLTAWAQGAPATRRLRLIDLRQARVSEHTVLPVPDVAPLPVAPLPVVAAPLPVS